MHVTLPGLRKLNKQMNNLRCFNTKKGCVFRRRFRCVDTMRRFQTCCKQCIARPAFRNVKCICISIYNIHTPQNKKLKVFKFIFTFFN